MNQEKIKCYVPSVKHSLLKLNAKYLWKRG